MSADIDDRPEIALLALPETSASALHGLYDLLASPGRVWESLVNGRPGHSLLRPRIVAAGGTGFRVGNGIRIEPDASLEVCREPAVAVVPRLMVAPTEELSGRFAAEIAWLRRCRERGSILASACTGALLFAEAGLLDGLDATSHWAYCDAIAERYPRIRMHPDRALVASAPGHRVITAGGGTAWLDLGLYLIARLAGVDEAMRVARMQLIDWHHGGQQPFAALTSAGAIKDDVVTGCRQWIAEHYDGPRPVAGMVGRSGLAERSFKRRFKRATGMTPIAYVQIVRLEQAKQLLETTDQSIDAIAERVGYEDASFFGRLFHRRVGLTPAEYRRRFRGMRRELLEDPAIRGSGTEELTEQPWPWTGTPASRPAGGARH